MAAGRIKGITIEIGGDTTKLVTSLKNVDKEIKGTQTALKDINGLLKMDPGNVELLRQKQAQLNDAVSLTKDRLNQLKDAQSQVAQGTGDWDALQREIIETEQNLQSLEAETKAFGSVSTQQLKAVGSKFQEVGGKIEGAGQKLAGISAAAAAGLGALGKLGYDAVTAADDLNTLSKQTGVSTDELQKWSYAADLVDVDVDSITGAMRKMKKGLESNADTFEELGVKTKDGSGNMRDATDIFYDTIEALSEVDNETERDIIAMQLFGKSADELAGVIDDGGAALKAYGEEAEQMGLIIGGDTLDRLNDVNDTIDKLKATFGASLAEAGATIAETFAPALENLVGLLNSVAEYIRNLTPEQVQMITTILGVVAALAPVLMMLGKLVSVIGFVMQNLTAIEGVIAAITGPIGIAIAAIAAFIAIFVYLFNTNEEFREKCLEVWTQVQEGISLFVETARAFLTEFIEWVQPIFMVLVEAASEAMNIIGEIFTEIGAWIEENRAEIEAAVAVIRTVVMFLVNIIKAYVITQIAIIKEQITAFLNIISNLFKAFSALLKGDWRAAWNYLVQAVSSYGNMLKNIFLRIVDGIKMIFGGLIEKMKNWGREMIENLISGIKEKIGGVAEAITGGLGKFASFFTGAGEAAGNILGNLQESALGAIGDLVPVQASMARTASTMTANRSTATPALALQSAPVVVNVALEGDATRLFRVVKAEAVRTQQITGMAFV